MKTASAQHEAEVVCPEPELSVVSSPGDSSVWELATDRIYRYVSNGTYYYQYQNCTSVKHCREFCARNSDELHEASAFLFEQPHSVVLGFQMLGEAYSGLHTTEILKWGQDGFGTTTQDAKDVNLWRQKGQHHNNPYCSNHEGLRALLEAHEAWKSLHYPESPLVSAEPLRRPCRERRTGTRAQATR